MQSIILLGVGGHAHSVVDSIEAAGLYDICGFLDRDCKTGEAYRGYQVLGTDDLLEECFRKGIRNAFVTVGYMGRGEVRNRLYDRLKTLGFNIPVIMDKTAVVAKDALIGEGTFIGKTTVINSAARIGNMCIVNTGAIIEHDCEVASFSHISVGSVLCGNVQIGRSSFVGANATVIQGKSIGNQCVIGAGTTVRKNVEDNHMVWDGKRKIIGGGV